MVENSRRIAGGCFYFSHKGSVLEIKSKNGCLNKLHVIYKITYTILCCYIPVTFELKSVQELEKQNSI